MEASRGTSFASALLVSFCCSPISATIGMIGLFLTGPAPSRPAPHFTDDGGQPFVLHLDPIETHKSLDLNARPPARRLLRMAGPPSPGPSMPRLVPELRMGEFATEGAIAAGTALILFGTLFRADAR